MLLVQSVTQEITCFEIVPNSTAIQYTTFPRTRSGNSETCFHPAHSIYSRTVETNPHFSFGKFLSFLAGLGRNQKYGACCKLVALPKVPINQFSKADNRCQELTVLIFIYLYCDPAQMEKET